MSHSPAHWFVASDDHDLATPLEEARDSLAYWEERARRHLPRLTLACVALAVAAVVVLAEIVFG